ncbi:MAG: VWA domain-containing protein, partial [Anaerolineae bacterium]
GYSPVVSGTTDLRTHPLWGDWEQPLRGSKEAAKRSVIRLDPKRDQVGLVTYGTDSTQDSQLECISRWGSACYEGTTPISYTRVLAAIESVSSGTRTCTGCGMEDGLKVLGINIDNQNNFDNDCDGGANSHCARGGAKKVMILITDGIPNESPGGVSDDEDYYPGENADYDCMIYYAQKAAERGVVIYPIGLGFGVDANLLEAVAEEGGGFYRPAYSASNLDEIFNEIISTTTTSCSPQNLTLTKSAMPSEGLGVGDIITYSLSFSNSGDLAATHVVLTDRLPVNTQFVTASGSFTPPAPAPGDVITWTLGQLEGGATGVQSLTVVISPTQSGDVITNVAGIYGDQDRGQATITIPFTPPTIDESHPIYLPIILKSSQVWAQR